MPHCYSYFILYLCLWLANIVAEDQLDRLASEQACVQTQKRGHTQKAGLKRDGLRACKRSLKNLSRKREINIQLLSCPPAGILPRSTAHFMPSRRLALNKTGWRALADPHRPVVTPSSQSVLAKLGLGDLNVVSGSEILCVSPPWAGCHHPRWNGETWAWGGSVREMSLTTLVTKESRPLVRKAPGLIHHAPLNPLSFQSSHSSFSFSYFLQALCPAVADRVTLLDLFWCRWRGDVGIKRIGQWRPIAGWEARGRKRF